MTLPIINIPWVGLPTTDGLQDAAFVKKLSQQLDNAKKEQKIKFWCLKDFELHYARLFNTCPNIEVFAIEEQCAHDTKMCTSIALIKDSGLENLEWVIGLKDTLTLFILAYHGGYVLDANIIGQGDSLELLNHEKSIVQTRENIPAGDQQELECQIQFAPQTDSINQWALDAANYCNDELQSRIAFIKNNHTRLQQLQYMHGDEHVIQLRSLQGLGVKGMYEILNKPEVRNSINFITFTPQPLWKGTSQVILPGDTPVATRTLLKFCCKSYCLNRRNNYLPPIYFMVADYKDHPQFLKTVLQYSPEIINMKVTGSFRLRTKENATPLNNYTLFNHAECFCPEAMEILHETNKEQKAINKSERIMALAL